MVYRFRFQGVVLRFALKVEMRFQGSGLKGVGSWDQIEGLAGLRMVFC